VLSRWEQQLSEWHTIVELYGTAHFLESGSCVGTSLLDQLLPSAVWYTMLSTSFRPQNTQGGLSLQASLHARHVPALQEPFLTLPCLLLPLIPGIRQEGRQLSAPCPSRLYADVGTSRARLQQLQRSAYQTQASHALQQQQEQRASPQQSSEEHHINPEEWDMNYW
jgi:hypothetical protein